ncbi:hypothetical protein QQS21_001670 [Conoideocrella luteorostrata]|uniref:Phosphoglycerate mutase n=1 Tax=Conoideocrella luteorostrata TaxID=1105319 RepID=A0AAJ0CZ17_9HYPO|nr:hypothetical protein QQS21_001670 [Conoideocrella luteorostrata]
MSDREALTPRVYIVRHGQTEWAKKGKYTGTTDIKLTEEGVRQVSSMAATLVGPGKYINTSRIAYVFVSPRQRAIQTYKLMLPSSMIAKPKWKVETTEEVAEWNYGKYEGLTTEEIKDLRKSKGLDQKREWSIWKDGCDFDGGE